MHHALKFIAIFLVVATLSITAVVIGYDLIYFQPALSEAQKKVPLAGKSTLTPLLERYLEAAYGPNLQFHVARVLLYSKREHSVLREFFWGRLVGFHLTAKEQYNLVASQAFLGSGHYGFASAAQGMFAKSVEQLSPEEAATLVILLQAPSSYESNPERMARRRESLLKKVKNSH